MSEKEKAARQWCEDFEFLDLPLEGSPRRSLERHVVRCGSEYVLERIPWKKMRLKKEESKVMDILHSKSLPVLRYVRNSNGDLITKINGHIWMMKEYVRGVPLPRPAFLDDGWRGRVMSSFLISLKNSSINSNLRDFSLKTFIEGQKKGIERRYPELKKKLEPIYSFIMEFLKIYDFLPETFNHGDFHPMNIIWSDKGINAVIDWEFMGNRPELYDASNMVGCSGIEHPSAIERDMVKEFVYNLLKNGEFSDISWRFFPHLVVASRFQWLHEWMLTNDREMIDLEVTYMNILVENRDLLYDLQNH